MKKLFKKKVSFFGKEVSVFLLAIIGVVGLASAALVPYISNTVFGIVSVSSPLTLIATGGSESVEIEPGGEAFSIDIVGGESFYVDSELTVNGEEDVTGHLGEIKMLGFDGEGIELTYEVLGPVPGGPFPIAPCTFEDDTYYYIGDSEDVLPAGLVLTARTDFDSVLNLEPRVYESENRVILAEERACTAEA